MKQVTLKIPDNKYSFFMELVKNLGLESVRENSPDSDIESKVTVASLRGKLGLSKDQYKNFHQSLNDSRNEWSRNI